MVNPGINHPNLVLLYVPCGAADEAEKIARKLIEERLIACANIYQSRSLYMWEGSLAAEVEHVLVCKTVPARADAAERRVRELHSYKVPCIIQLQPAHANYDYASWVAGEVFGPAPAGSALVP